MSAPEPAFEGGVWALPLPSDTREVIEVRAGDLLIDRNAQREVNQERVARIAQEFDWARFEMPTCARLADGRLRVVEGQHRILGLRMRDPAASCRVLVIDGGASTLGDESGLALAITATRRTHTALDRWELRLRRGDPHETQAEEVLRRHGLRLGQHASPTSIACAGLVADLVHAERQTAEAGADNLNLILTIVEKAYPRDEPDSATSRWNRDLLRAVGTLVLRNPGLKPLKLTAALRDRIAQQWIAQGTAAAERSTWVVIAETLAQRYNKGARSEKARIGL
jgi:hypothetical protein